MSTIAINKNSYAVREERVSLIERMKRFFAENQKMITSGLLLINGNTGAFQMYGLMK